MSKLKRTPEEFVEEVAQKRPDVTVLSEYKGVTKPIKLRCECGWEYQQTPHNLLRNRKGCFMCGNPSNASITTELFIEKAKKIHNNFYDYSLVDYKDAHTKVDIICPIHGKFSQRPYTHNSQKSGCKSCASERTKDFVGWTYSEWETAGLKSLNFTGFKLYKIRCYDPETNEQFIKVGKTFINIANRFKSFPYEYEILEVKEGSARFISELEITTQQELKHKKYIPSKPFSGMTECFTL